MTPLLLLPCPANTTLPRQKAREKLTSCGDEMGLSLPRGARTETGKKGREEEEEEEDQEWILLRSPPLLLLTRESEKSCPDMRLNLDSP